MMLRTIKRVLTIVFVVIFCMMAFPLYSAEGYSVEHKNLFSEFVSKMNYGEEQEFYDIAARYEQYLKDHGFVEEYYKIKTNEVLFDVGHQHPVRAMSTAQQLDRELRAAGDSTYYYLGTGVKADVYKMMHSSRADSIYKQALREVGGRDPKFTMLVHMSLAQVNYLSNPSEAKEWANLSLSEAEQLDNTEYRSMSLGLLCYLHFMLDEREQFEATAERYERLRQEFDSLHVKGASHGRQRFSHRYDVLIRVAKLAFEGKFDEASDLAHDPQLNVERQIVLYRINGLEGLYKKEQAHNRLVWGFAVMTALYIFVYIMGRRRLWLKIQQRKAELQVALEKAETANKMKAAFIRSMSHEVRTPLNAINGFSQILCSPEFDLSEEEKNDLKRRITSSSEAITIIINELLELAAGESVTLDEDSFLPVNVNEVCRVVTAMADEHNTKSLAMSFSTELDETFTIRSNSETLSQILSKIIDNALKFTNEGSVTVHASLEGRQVEISVADTGIGVPEDRREDIFENFVKLDDYKEGVGLGLPICRRLVKTLGGDIVLDSSYKKGCRFIVILPVK